MHYAYKLMYFDRNINGNRDVKFLIAIIGHCTDQRKLLQQRMKLRPILHMSIAQLDFCSLFLPFLLTHFIYLLTQNLRTYAINSSSMHGNFSHIRPTIQSSLVQILAWLTAVWSVGCAGPGLSGETSRAKRSSSFEYRLIARH